MRTFVAIELPEDIERVVELQAEQIRSGVDAGAIRWVQPSGIHLTLKFLGEVDRSNLADLISAVGQETARHLKFAFEIQGFGCFPDLRRPRVLWLGVREESGTLNELQGGLERSLEALGFRREGRPFHAHLTIGRVRREVRGDGMRRLVEAVSSIQVGSLGQVMVGGVSLMRSDLRPTGAVYSQLHFAPLGEG